LLNPKAQFQSEKMRFWILLVALLNIFSSCFAQFGGFGGGPIPDPPHEPHPDDGTIHLEDFGELVEDRDHIKEEFEDYLSDADINAMEQDQVSFTWFSAHDSDESESLDGLELYKAILHAHGGGTTSEPKGGLAGEHGEVEHILDPFKVEYVEALVDELLASYDVNNDGLLDFPEFMKGFHEQSHKMS